MNGRLIKEIHFGNANQDVIRERDEMTLEWSHCDVIGTWIIHKKNGVETARHNVRFIETIIWK